jgi:hypothetical protein
MVRRTHRALISNAASSRQIAILDGFFRWNGEWQKKPLPKQGAPTWHLWPTSNSRANERWQTSQRINTDLPIIDITGDGADKWPSWRPNSILLEKPFQPAQLIGAVSQLRNDATPSRSWRPC